MTVANAHAPEQFAGLVDHIVGEVQFSVTALLCDTFHKILSKATEQSIALVYRQMIGYSSRLSDHMANAKSLERGSHTAGTIAHPTHRHITSDQPVSKIRSDGFWPSEQLCQKARFKREIPVDHPGATVQISHLPTGQNSARMPRISLPQCTDGRQGQNRISQPTGVNQEKSPNCQRNPPLLSLMRSLDPLFRHDLPREFKVGRCIDVLKRQ